MVRTNLSAIKEQALVRALSERQQAALEAVEASRQRVISSVGERA
jgi:formiminotetrahydrofolate cyclodeaminase